MAGRCLTGLFCGPSPQSGQEPSTFLTWVSPWTCCTLSLTAVGSTVTSSRQCLPHMCTLLYCHSSSQSGLLMKLDACPVCVHEQLASFYSLTMSACACIALHYKTMLIVSQQQVLLSAVPHRAKISPLASALPQVYPSISMNMAFPNGLLGQFLVLLLRLQRCQILLCPILRSAHFC